MFLLQWNCNGILSHFNELKTIIYKHNPAVVCIQESHLLPSKKFSFRGYQIFRKDYTLGMKACGGTLTMVQNNIPVSQISLNTYLQANAVTIKIPEFSNNKITICNMYIPLTKHPPFKI